MKKALFSITLFTLTLLLCFTCLTACGKGISGDEAKATTNQLFAALSTHDYEAAAALFHPEAQITAQDMSDFCTALRQEYNMDVSKGMTVDRYTGFNVSLYDTSVGGSRYELTMRVIIGEATYTFSTEVIRNDNGYGLIGIHYNP